jgi:hypothetical protein
VAKRVRLGDIVHASYLGLCQAAIVVEAGERSLNLHLFGSRCANFDQVLFEVPHEERPDDKPRHTWHWAWECPGGK